MRATQNAFLLLVLAVHLIPPKVSGFSTTPVLTTWTSTNGAFLRRPLQRRINFPEKQKGRLLLRLSENNDSNQEPSTERSQGLRKALSALGEVSDSEIQVGSTVVAGNNIPNLGIWQFQSYELVSIYDQGTTEDGVVEKIARTSLQDPVQPASYTRYVSLYSEKHHQDGPPVIVSPNEVELSSMQQEVLSSLLQAMPLFVFWTALAFSFANQYSQKTGGTFLDAMFGR